MDMAGLNQKVGDGVNPFSISYGVDDVAPLCVEYVDPNDETRYADFVKEFLENLPNV